METFNDGLLRMLLKLEVVTSQQNENAVIVFACGCAIFGVIAVALDFSFYLLRGQSLLKLAHGKNTILFLLAWAVGSFIMGYIGQVARIFQVSLLACAVVGFAWPILFTDFLESLKQKESETEPEQEPVEEV